jgi:hypothetical protein
VVAKAVNFGGFDSELIWFQDRPTGVPDSTRSFTFLMGMPCAEVTVAENQLASALCRLANPLGTPKVPRKFAFSFVPFQRCTGTMALTTSPQKLHPLKRTRSSLSPSAAAILLARFIPAMKTRSVLTVSLAENVYVRSLNSTTPPEGSCAMAPLMQVWS